MMPIRGDQSEVAERRNLWRLLERPRNDAALNGAGSGKLGCLRDVLSKDKLVFDLFPEPRVLKGFLRGAAIGCILGIGNREFLQAAVGKRGSQVCKLAIRREGR